MAPTHSLTPRGGKGFGGFGSKGKGKDKDGGEAEVGGGSASLTPIIESAPGFKVSTS